MSELTHAERLAAGWRESWVVRCNGGTYTTGVREWGTGMWRNDRKEAFRFTTYCDAANWIGWFVDNRSAIFAPYRDDIRIRRLWTRKKPKAPPALKIGDAVLVLAEVVTSETDEGVVTVRCKMTSGRTCVTWVRRQDITKAGAAK